MSIYCVDTKETLQTYKAYLKSAHWQRFKIMKLHKVCACEVCLSKERLCLHHKTYATLGNEQLSDVIVLCNKCHSLLHEFIGVIDRTLKAKTEEFLQLMKVCTYPAVEKKKYVAGREKPKPPKKKKQKRKALT